jgi:UDP-N-acetylmuramoylalanine--D-glutamate ligase
LKPRPDLPPGPYLIVGLARSGAAAALALRALGAEVIGLDSGSPPELDALAAAGVELHPRAQGLELLERAATVVKSPGVPATAPVVARARAQGIRVLGELELAWRMLPNEVIAVTGTNGKTTTVELIGHIHRQAALPVAVAGNVGTALSSLVGVAEAPVTVVCEASSFQLEDALAFAPEAAVLLNIAPDHLDRHGTAEAYLAAKLRIFAHQDPADVAVIPFDFRAHLPGAARRVRFGGGIPSAEAPRAEMSHHDGALWWGGERLIETRELRLRGAHNACNAMAAAAVCLARGVPREAVVTSLRLFAGVAHRLQEVRSRAGVLYVNDSKATNVASTLVALAAMREHHHPVHLILGGQGKGQDFTALRVPIARERAVRAVYLIGEDSPAIEQALADTDVAVHECGTLERALALAAAAAAPGEAVLLAPACASFDQFADFEARGERFAELVQAL